MLDLNLLEDNCIIISPRETKKQILSLINLLDIRVKFLSKEEIFQNAFFSYDDEAIIYLIKKKYSYSNAKEILNNLYFVKPLNEKLTNLNNILSELDENNLIRKNPMFFSLFKNKKVYIYNYSEYDLELINILKLNHINYQFIKDEKTNFNQKVIEFKDAEEEVDEFFNQVCLLVEKGVKLENIKLYSYSQEYDLILKKYASFYHIPVNFASKVTLYSSFYFKRFLQIYNSHTLDESFSLIKEEIKKDSYGFLDKLGDLIINIASLFEDKNQERAYLIEKAKDISLKKPIYQNGINIVSSDYTKDDYIFIIGFNLLSFPKVNKDTTYLNDQDKSLININTSKIINQILEDDLIRFISSHRHLFISYKKYIGKEVYYPSLIIEKMNMEVVKTYLKKDCFSLDSLKIKIGKEYDLKFRYGIDSKYFEAIDFNLLDYKTYNHKFKPFSTLINEDKIITSYSKINCYNNCPFSYYVDYVLKLTSVDNNFKLDLGTFFHKILQDASQKEVNYNDYLIMCDNLFTKPSENYFAKKLIEQVKTVVKFNQEFLDHNENLKVICEKEINAQIDENLCLNGKIDKIIYSDVNKALMIVDYKTGNTSFDSDKVEYGLSLQLPLYSILAKAYFPNYKQMGIYIQNVLNDASETTNELRLRGITKNDRKLIETFDQDIKYPKSKSKYIYGISVSKEDELKESKTLLDEKNWNEIVRKSEEKLKESISKIRSGDFSIAPIKYNEEKLPCSYCKHSSICFKEKDDERIIIVESEGDNNA